MSQSTRYSNREQRLQASPVFFVCFFFPRVSFATGLFAQKRNWTVKHASSVLRFAKFRCDHLKLLEIFFKARKKFPTLPVLHLIITLTLPETNHARGGGLFICKGCGRRGGEVTKRSIRVQPDKDRGLCWIDLSWGGGQVVFFRKDNIEEEQTELVSKHALSHFCFHWWTLSCLPFRMSPPSDV